MISDTAKFHGVILLTHAYLAYKGILLLIKYIPFISVLSFLKRYRVYNKKI